MIGVIWLNDEGVIQHNDGIAARYVVQSLSERSTLPIWKTIALNHKPLRQWLRKAFSARVDAQQEFAVRREGQTERFCFYLRFAPERESTWKGAVLLIDSASRQPDPSSPTEREAIALKLAHEVKNSLTSIGLLFQHIGLELAHNPALKEKISPLLEKGSQEIEYLRRIARNFLEFSRAQEEKAEPVDLGELLRDIIRRFTLTLPEAIEMEANIPADLPVVRAHSHQVVTVLNNLLHNAAGAINDRGKIGFTVETVEKTERLPLFDQQVVIRFTIEDNGRGMSKKVLKKVFQPFFTTREGGTGLGLPIVQKIVHSTGGEVSMTSKKGKGTRVVVIWPFSQA